MFQVSFICWSDWEFLLVGSRVKERKRRRIVSWSSSCPSSVSSLIFPLFSFLIYPLSGPEHPACLPFPSSATSTQHERRQCESLSLSRFPSVARHVSTFFVLFSLLISTVTREFQLDLDRLSLERERIDFERAKMAERERRLLEEERKLREERARVEAERNMLKHETGSLQNGRGGRTVAYDA